MKKRILITATELHMLQFWLYHIRHLTEAGYAVELICSHVGGRLEDLRARLSEIGDIRLTVVDLKRSPVSPHNIHGYFQLRQYLAGNHYDVIITNEPVMGFMTRLAARTVRRKNGTKVIYFAHGFHFWKGCPIQNWLLLYPLEKIGAHFTDTLVTMNTEDFARAKQHLRANQVVYTYGIGADLSKFSDVPGIRENKRKELHVSDDTFVLFSAAELSDRKNLTLAIDVVEKLRDEGCNVQYFNRGVGPKEEELRRYIAQKHLENQVILMGYGRDVRDMCLAADAFLFTSKQEGLPVAVMEAMSCRLPCVVSAIRGVTDLIHDGAGGYACPLGDVDAFCDRIKLLIHQRDTNFRRELTEKNAEVLAPYSIENVHGFIVQLIEQA